MVMMKVKFYGPLKNPSDDVDDKCGRDKIIHFSAVGKNQRWFRVGGDKIPKCQVKIGPSMNSKEVRQKWTITQTHVLIGGQRQMYKVYTVIPHIFLEPFLWLKIWVIHLTFLRWPESIKTVITFAKTFLVWSTLVWGAKCQTFQMGLC